MKNYSENMILGVLVAAWALGTATRAAAQGAPPAQGYGQPAPPSQGAPPAPGYRQPAPPQGAPPAQGYQAPPAATATAPAPATTSPYPYAPQPTPTPAPPTGSACVPDCRSGYVCVNAQCVSACNPPCALGEACTPDARCVRQSAPQAAYPAAPPPGAPPPSGFGQPGEPGYPPPAAEQPRPGAHLHDGFYFRMGIGLGGVTGSAQPKGDSSSADFSGLAVPVELAIGGSPVPGVVVGVGIYGATIPSLALSYLGQDFESDAVVSTIGPFIDVYPNPIQGLHVQAALTYSVVTVSQSTTKAIYNNGTYDYVSFPPDDYSGSGFGLMGGIGYEWWVGQQWSIGVLARVQYASVTLKPASSTSGTDADAHVILPAALFTATYQ